jgi:hypothetical protein
MPSASSMYAAYCALERAAAARAKSSGNQQRIAQAHADEDHARGMKRQLEPLVAEEAERGAADLNASLLDRDEAA